MNKNISVSKSKVFQSILLLVTLSTLILPWISVFGEFEHMGYELMRDKKLLIAICSAVFLTCVWFERPPVNGICMVLKLTMLAIMFGLSLDTVYFLKGYMTPYYMIWITMIGVTAMISILMSTKLGLSFE